MNPESRILIVEDDPTLQRVLKDNFEFAGYRVQVAEDGLKGWQAVQSFDPELILLDVMLPKVNGFDLCRRIRREQIKTPIIMLTAKNQESDVILGLDIGADDYVSKPFSIDVLLARAAVCLRRSDDTPTDEPVSTFHGSIAESLKHYEILEKLGEGGMGEVFRAKDTILQREVALKVITKERLGHQDANKRFLREAVAAAKLNHPNIVQLYAIEEINDKSFLVLELVHGKTLNHWAGGRSLEWNDLLVITNQLCSALTAAHELGIIHRDLKPSNMIVTANKTLKILDFGLAKIMSVPQNNMTITATMETDATKTGAVMGTAHYMSPEQIRGGEIDRQTDLFSLGVVLYELSTGQRPFKGNNVPTVLSSILRDPTPDLQSIRSDLPNHFTKIVSACLNKAPKDRPSAASTIQSELNLTGLR